MSNPDLIRQRFSKASNTYSHNASMQQLAADKLFQMIQSLNLYPQRIVEIGAGTGYLTSKLRAEFPSTEYLANDLVDTYTERYTSMNCGTMMGDITKISLPLDVDLIASSSCFQWIDDLPTFLAKLKSCLKKDAVLAFSTFGIEHFTELKQINNYGLDYHSAEEIENFIRQAGFANVVIRQMRDTMYFDSAAQMLRYFSSTGVNSIHREHWTPGRLKDFEQRYIDMYEDQHRRLPLSIHHLWVIVS